MFLQQAQSACTYSTWHPQVLLLKKIPRTSPNVQPCQCWSSILRSLSVVAVCRPHCHRLNWALCNRPLHIHFPIKKLVKGLLFIGALSCKHAVIIAVSQNEFICKTLACHHYYCKITLHISFSCVAVQQTFFSYFVCRHLSSCF